MSKIVVAIVRKENEVLMARRKINEGNLHWQFPGGKLKEYETEYQAAEREIFEETGVKCKTIEKLGERVHPANGKAIAYILCEYVSGSAAVKDSNELDRVEWMTPSVIFQKITSDLFKPVRNYLQSLQRVDNMKEHPTIAEVRKIRRAIAAEHGYGP